VSLTLSLQPLPPLLPPVIIPEIVEVTPTPIVEYPEEEEREPWWVDIAAWIGNWIVDTVLRPATEWFVELINWITDELRYWKHLFFEALADLYATDLGFLYISLGTILIGVYAPQIIAKIAASGFGLAIKNITAWIKEKIGNILNLAAIEDILALNEMAKLFWPEWRELMSMLSDATSALAEELGQGSAYISAWFSTVHAFALLGTSFLDIEPEAAELQAFEETESFLKKINEKFRDYSHNPGQIVRDIIDELYIPHARQFKDAQASLIGTVADARDDINETFDLIQNAHDTLEHFIGIQPEETAAIVEEKLGPIRDGLDDFIYEYRVNVLPKIEGTIKILEDRADMIEERNAILATKVDDPLYTLAMYDLMTDTEKSAFNRGTMLIAAAGENEELEVSLPSLDGVADAMIGATERYYFEDLTVVQPIRPALSLEFPGIPSTAAFPSWFRGEG